MNGLDHTLLETVIEALSKPRTLNQLIALCSTSGDPKQRNKTHWLVVGALLKLHDMGILVDKNTGDELMYSLKPVNALELLRQEFPLNYELATVPKPATLYNWSNAPVSSVYGCVDNSGVGWWCSEKPVIFRNGQWADGGYVYEMKPSDILTKTRGEKSLEEKPRNTHCLYCAKNNPHRTDADYCPNCGRDTSK